MPARKDTEKVGAKPAEKPKNGTETKKTALFKKAEDLFKKAGVLDEVSESEERIITSDNETVNVVFTTFSTGKEAIKEVIFEFMTADDDGKEFGAYSIEIMKKDMVLCFYKN